MSLTLTLDLPPELEERLRRETQNLNAEVKEAYALELYRQRRLSHYELSHVLGLDRFQTSALLQRHRIYEGSITMEDLEEQRETLNRVMGKATP